MLDERRRRILRQMNVDVWLLRAAPGTGREARPAARAAAEEAFTVVSVALPGVVLLLEGAGSRRDMRLARDLVSAVAGDWDRKPERRRFVWPPTSGTVPGAVPGAGSASGRALRAFADKDLEDHGAQVLICAGKVGERLPDPGRDVRVLRVPALSELSRDAAAKRRLWTELSAVP